MGYDFTRTIVKKGVILLTPQQRQVTGFTVWCQIERIPGNRSINLKYPRPKSWYGIVQRLVRGYVVETIPLEYENQLIYDFRNPDQEQTIFDLCLFNALAVGLGGSFGSLLNAVGDLLQATTLLEVEGPPKIETALFNRMETDAFLVKLFNDTTAVFRVYGQEPPNPCDIDVDWAEPAGPALPSPDSPTTPSPAPNIPPNDRDPDGLDLPDLPYNRDDDDDGDSYDPPRPGDLQPPQVGGGPWVLIVKIQGHSPFPPYPPEGQVSEIRIDFSSTRVTNPQITSITQSRPGETPQFPWNQLVRFSYDLVPPGGLIQNSEYSVLGSADEIVDAKFEKP